MGYQKTTWVNGQAPAINANNLNNLETQYDKAKADLESHKAEKATSSELGHIKQGNRVTIIDGVLSANQQIEIAKGTYSGDGTSPRTITVGFTPDLLFLTTLNRTGDQVMTSILFYSGVGGRIFDQSNAASSLFSFEQSNNGGQIVTNGFSVGVVIASQSFNLSGYNYAWIAIKVV